MTAAVPLVERLAGAFRSSTRNPEHLAFLVLPVVEQAVAEARGEALRDAADFIADTAGIGESANDFGRGWYGALDYAVGELRNRADAIATTKGAP